MGVSSPCIKTLIILLFRIQIRIGEKFTHVISVIDRPMSIEHSEKMFLFKTEVREKSGENSLGGKRQTVFCFPSGSDL